jgi:hypothetical protein
MEPRMTSAIGTKSTASREGVKPIPSEALRRHFDKFVVAAPTE